MKNQQLNHSTITERALHAINELKQGWEQTAEKTPVNADRCHNRAYGVFVLWNELTGEGQNVNDRI